MIAFHWLFALVLTFRAVGVSHTSIGCATARAALSSFLPSGGRFLGLPLLPSTEGYRVRAVVVGRANRRLEAQSRSPHEVLSNGASSLKPTKLHPGSSTSNGRPIPINRQIDNMTRIPRERRGSDRGSISGVPAISAALCGRNTFQGGYDKDVEGAIKCHRFARKHMPCSKT